MKCIQVKEIGSFDVTDVPQPKPGVGDVLVRVDVTGLCRTDLKIIRVGHRDLVLPRIPGEEVVGTVVASGPDTIGFTPGERVYVYPGIWCAGCSACRKGAQNLCREMEIMGFHRDGGFAQYVLVPIQSLIRVPDGLHPDQAVFAEPLSCCLNALELGGIQPGQRVGIWGAGPAGTLLSRAAFALGADPLSIDPDQRRCELIDGCPNCPDETFDLCVVAVGAKTAYAEALGCLAPRGRLVVFSGLAPADDALPVSFNQLHYHEQTLVGAYGCSYRHGEQALAMLAGEQVSVADMVSHRMSLYDLEDALELVARRAGMKILLYP